MERRVCREPGCELTDSHRGLHYRSTAGARGSVWGCPDRNFPGHGSRYRDHLCNWQDDSCPAMRRIVATNE